MKSFFVRERVVALLGVASIVTLAACEDRRVKALDTGISMDSAVAILSPGAKRTQAGLDSTAANVAWQDRYLINGKNYEIIYFSGNDEKRSGRDSVFKGLTPVVFVDGKMIGKGWAFWDSTSKALKIPVKKH